jgi:hypothetical protein
MSLKRSANAAGLPDRVVDDAPCCWLCLEEGPDDDASGKPLVRNCSCRGISGFAHLSCAVTFAEHESREAYKRDEYSNAFIICPNCKQEYQGEVQHAMAKAQIEFIEREYKNNHKLYLEAMGFNMYSLDFEDEQHRLEGEVICSKMLSIIEKVDKDPSLQHNGMNHSMARAHHSMGLFHKEFGSKDNLEKAKKNYERAKVLYEMVGEEVSVMTIERQICIVVAKLNGNEVELDAREEIIYWQKCYNHWLEKWGESHIMTIKKGVELAIALYKADHTIDAERFLTQLVANSRRVNGVEHNVSEKTLAELERVKVRRVCVNAEQGLFHALQYENDGDKIVVRGPLPKCLNERKVEEEKTLTFESKDVVPIKGTPVVCHGLMSHHLNGKIGDIRAFSKDNSVCEVHFEEEGLEPTQGKLDNVRILFDLPDNKK